MPQEIRVDTIASHSEFETLDEAVLSGVATARNERNTKAKSQLVGGVIDAVSYSRDVVEVLISTGFVLSVIAAGEIFEWEVRPERPLRSFSNRARTFVLDWELPRKQVWNCAELLESRRGGRVERIFANQSHLYLYVKDLPILAFTVLRVRDDGGTMLWWNDSD